MNYKPAKLYMPKNHKSRWYVFYYYLNPNTGQMQRFKESAKIIGNSIEEKKQSAQKIIDTINDRLTAGFSPFESFTEADKHKRKRIDYSINEHLTNWIEDRKNRMRSKSYSSYKTKITIFLQYCKDLKIRNFDKLNTTIIDNFCRYLLEQRKESPATYNSYISTLRLAFDDIQRNMPIINYFKKIKLLSEHKQGKLPFKNFQRNILKDRLINESQLWLFVQFMFYTFIRPGELRLLKIGDIDFEDSKILIRAEISKNKRSQFVLIPTQLLNVLNDMQLYKFHQSFYIFGKAGIPSDKPTSRDYFSKKHKKILDELGFSNLYSLYSWKHTGAITAVKNGFSAKEIQIQMRHHSLDMTDVYLKSMGYNENLNIVSKFPSI